jgi:hypothetical protein
VIRRAEAQRLADLRLQEAWSARETISFALSPRAIAHEPGDVIALPVDGENRLYRITRINDGLHRQIEARLVEPSIYAAAAGADAARAVTAPPVAGPPWVETFDMPLLPSISGLLHLAVSADPWPGGFAIFRQDNPGGVFRDAAFAQVPAMIGELVTSLVAGPVWRWDRRSSVDIRLTGAGLSSATDLDALAGRNALAIKGPDGLVEVIIAGQVTMLGNGVYRLSRLLRGIGGTEDAAARVVPIGTRCVVLDGSLLPLTDGTGDLGQSITWRAVAAGLDASDPLAVQVSAVVGARSLKPLSPVHLSARRITGGIRIGWIRRTRVDGDAWEQAEVPLGEDIETYQLEILAGSVVKRLMDITMPEWFYPSASELTDFGAPQSQISLRVAQMSAAAGRGLAASALVPIL